MLAPIIIFCYNRPLHLQKTLAALKENELAKDSLLYVFSDAAKSNEDQREVEEVKKLVKEITGFKELKLTFANENKGLAKSVIEGVSTVLNLHKKAIILEDDILVSNDFLSYMNSALDTYENAKSIYSVSGYSYKLESLNLNEDVSLVKRASSWGWGTWYDRWENVDWEVRDFKTFMADPNQKSQFQNAGIDLLPMLVKQKTGEIDSWAIRWTFHHYLNNAYCLVPKYSKVKNIGTDGSGTNFRNSISKYNTELHIGILKLPKNPKANPLVTSFIRNYYKPSFVRRLINYFRYRTW